MLTRDVNTRISAREIKNHLWFKFFSDNELTFSGNKDNDTIMECSETQKKNIVQDILEFSSFGTPKMRNIVLIYLATQLSEGSYKKMRYYFKEIDVDQNGTIQFQELKNFMMS